MIELGTKFKSDKSSPPNQETLTLFRIWILYLILMGTDDRAAPSFLPIGIPMKIVLYTNIILTILCSKDYFSENAHETCSPEFQTIEDFRAEVYENNPGIQPMFISRDDFLENVIGYYLKDTSLNLLQKPRIKFHSEMGMTIIQ
jgi:hypothetical protein